MSLTDNEAKVILLVILRRIMGDNLIKKMSRRYHILFTYLHSSNVAVEKLFTYARVQIIKRSL